MTLKSLSKGDTLIFLEKYQHKLNFVIPITYLFTLKRYKLEKEIILNKIKKKFSKKNIIIRSSALDEDKLNNSMAGKYDSFSDLKCEKDIINKYIDLVSKKFKSNKDQILIQEYIQGADKAGVVFTRNLNNNAPYYYINYDTSGKTNSITSGANSKDINFTVISRFKLSINKKFKKLLSVINGIEKIYSNDRLDIEFCIKNNKIYILQCRPLFSLLKTNDNEIKSMLINIEKKINKIKLNNPFLSGTTTYLSNMADWNPAEMIGSKPKILPLSLYSELITNNVWSQQRVNYNYKDVLYQPLLFSLGGSPYIDLRLDLNSFLPKNLPAKIEDKIIFESLNKIKKEPYLHDKIEFDVLETCFDLETHKKIKNFLNNKESKIYLSKLKKLTSEIFNQDTLNKEKIKISVLEKKIIKIKNSNLSEIQKIYFLVQNCKEYGTLPFSGAARCAFISTKILRSLKKLNILDQEDLEKFYSSVDSITVEMNNDLIKLKDKIISKKTFYKKFGHLRPSTYSISSKNYKEDFKKYFPNKLNIKKKKIEKFKLSKNKLSQISKIFKHNKININDKSFLNFARLSIYYREKFKLIFTKCIDEIFINLISLGKEINIKRNDFEFVSIQTILNTYNNVDMLKLRKILINEIKENKKKFIALSLIDLPDVIFNSKDIYNFNKTNSKPNYITEKNVIGKSIFFKKIKNNSQLNNKIIILDSADPGYDFLFSHNIKGLITKYGGANSHMSIRCLELGIPAMIGVGENSYNNFIKANIINIDCLNRKFKIIS